MPPSKDSGSEAAMRAAIYARFSSDRQSERSIDDQVALCRATCDQAGLIVVATYDDRAISGASTINRMGLQRLLRDARDHKFDVVVTEALDRLSRDQADLAGIHKRLRFLGIEIVTVQDGTASDIHIGVKGLLGQMYLRDLAQKTHRGQAGVVRDGRHNGGRSFGYRPVPGQPGVLTIDETEADIVRRIFGDYLRGHSPRDIAASLNREGIPGPRGPVWNASTIAGSRTRHNGLLQNELYAGIIVWNRQRFIKDPDTGKRVSRPNPPEQWMRAEAPQLRIIDEETWRATRTRQVQRGNEGARHRTSRPRHLLSGLVRCGVCGGSYTLAGVLRGSPAMRCSRMRETGTCSNRETISMAELEDRVLTAIERDLASPEALTELVREFHRARNARAADAAGRRQAIAARLAKLHSEIERTVDAIVEAGISAALKQRLAAQEAERDALEAEQQAIAAPPLTMHPRAAEQLGARIGKLKQWLAQGDAEHRDRAFAAIREIIDHIVVHPTERKKPVDLEVHGQLATLLGLSDATAGSEDPKTVEALVAGIGFEPMTFRL